MTLIDDRGRLFGSWNFVDAALFVFVLGVIPLGFVAYRVFRVPPPHIERIEPASQQVGPDVRVRMVGHDLRPYLRVWVSKTGQPFSVALASADLSQARLLIETPDLAEARLPDGLAPGGYDIHMFDGAQEVAVRVNAFTLTPPPAGHLEAVVRFAVDEALALLVREGDRDIITANGRPPSELGDARLTSVRPLDARAATIDVLAGRTTIHMPARAFEAVVTLPASKGAGDVWEYRRQTIRPGDPLTFETARYTMNGLILQVRHVDGTQAAAEETVSR